MLSPTDARLLLGRHDVAIGRFDVRESLDGVQPGVEVLTELERGVRVVNHAGPDVGMLDGRPPSTRASELMPASAAG